MTSSEQAAALPPTSELNRVFNDFRQVLKVARYHTPLQRIHRLHFNQSSLSLFHKQTAEAESVFNLLQPGHNTCLRVDLMRAIADLGESCSLRIPVTVLSRSNEVLLMRNNPSGQVVYKAFPTIKTAASALSKEVDNTSVPKPCFPRFLHKPCDSRASLLASASEIPPLWLSTSPSPQFAQQFIQPFTKTASLVRAHWKANRKVSTFYFLSRGPARRNTKPCIATKIPDLGIARSCSEVVLQEAEVCITHASSSLVVRKTKAIPELDRSIEEVVRVLNATVGKGRKVVETVCDFICDSQHRWVLLACKGFGFHKKREILTRTLELAPEIDLRFLMYPLVARKSELKQRLAGKLRAASVLFNRRDAVMGTLSHPDGHLKPESPDSFPQLQRTEPTPEPCACPTPMLEPEILTREVGRLEKLLEGSRKYKRVLQSRLDVVQKYGGVSRWQSLLQSLYCSFYSSPSVTVYFEEQVGFEECAHMLNVILRIVKGDYNFYYKEALRRLHIKLSISKFHYHFFLSTVKRILEDAGISHRDIEVVMERFTELEEYICANGRDECSLEG